MSGWPRPPSSDGGRNPTGGWGSIILCEVFGIGCPEPDPDYDDTPPDDGNGAGNGGPPKGDFPVPDPGGPLPA